MFIYAAIIKGKDGEIVSSGTLARSEKWAEILHGKQAKMTPKWATLYPLVRIAKFECTEVADETTD